MPTTKNHCRQSDETTTTSDVLVEPPNDADWPPSTTDTRDCTREQQVAIAQFVDVDSQRAGRLRILTDGSRAQAPLGAVQTPCGKGNRHEREVHKDGLHKQYLSEKWNIRQQWKAYRLHWHEVVHRVAIWHEHSEADERRHAERKEVDGKAHNHLVDLVANRHHRQNCSKANASQCPHQRAEP